LLLISILTERDSDMTNRTYRLLLGIAILLILYFDLTLAMYGLIGVLFIEGLTNWRIPLLVNRILQRPAEQREPRANKWPPQAEQAWRLLIGVMLLLTAVVFKDVVWFMPWFLGFAILGAGVSGVCPGLFGLRAVGCRL
jgi:hypothetical protein